MMGVEIMMDNEKGPEIKTSDINELKTVNELMGEIKEDNSKIMEAIQGLGQWVNALSRLIKSLREELTKTNDLIRNKGSKRLDPSTQNIVLEELNRTGVLYKTDIIRILNVDEKYAIDIMKKMSAIENGPIFSTGCGAKSSRLIRREYYSGEDEITVFVRKFIEILHKDGAISLGELAEELRVSKSKAHEIISRAKELGGRFVINGSIIFSEGNFPF